MKIKRIHTQVAIMSKEHKFSFDVSQHKLEYFPELNMFKIDETLVPISNIREVLLEENVQVEPPHVGSVSSIINEHGSAIKHTQKVKASQAKSEDIVTEPEVLADWYQAVPDKPAKDIKLKRKASSKTKVFAHTLGFNDPTT